MIKYEIDNKWCIKHKRLKHKTNCNHEILSKKCLKQWSIGHKTNHKYISTYALLWFEPSSPLFKGHYIFNIGKGWSPTREHIFFINDFKKTGGRQKLYCLKK